MKVFIGADHRGFELKEKLKIYLGDLGYDVEDLGNSVLDNDDDYPDFARAVCEKVLTGGMGVLICGSGAGMDIVANKIRGVRCALVWKEQLAKQARKHEDVNVISVPSDHIGFEEAKKIMKAFLETKFSGEERHVRRINKISK